MVLAVACGPGEDCASEEGPSVVVSQVLDADDESPLHGVEIIEIREESGVAGDLTKLVQPPGFGVAPGEHGLVCEVPCGFGAAGRRYFFRVDALFYEPSALLASRPDVRTSGCAADATEAGIIVRLQPTGTILHIDRDTVRPADSDRDRDNGG